MVLLCDSDSDEPEDSNRLRLKKSCDSISKEFGNDNRNPANSHSPQALAWGNTAPESSENHLNGFQEYSATRDPKLKLGENENGLQIIMPPIASVYIFRLTSGQRCSF